MHLANSELPGSISLVYSYIWCVCKCVLVCVVGREEIEGWGWSAIMPLIKIQQMDVKVRRYDARDILIPQSADVYRLLGLIGL